MSSMTAITVPREYGYVLLTATGTFFLGFWHGGRVSSFRKAAGLGYPTPYADSAHLSSADPSKKQALYLFNCAQRAHGNFLENFPSVLAALLIAGLRYPVIASVLALGWSVGRVVYAVGYTSKQSSDGKGRLGGSFFWLFQLGLYGLTGAVGWKLLTA